MVIIKIIIFICILIPPQCLLIEDYFYSLSDLEVFVETQADVIKRLQKYVSDEKTKLHVVTRYLNESLEENKEIKRDIFHYLGNPINAFKLIKMQRDLYLVENLIQHKTVFSKNGRLPYPSRNDLIGTTEGLIRLQTTYQLNITELANGILRTSQNGALYEEYFTPLATSDCFYIGISHESINHQEKMAWLKTAYEKSLVEDCYICFVDKGEIFERIATELYKLSDSRNAMDGGKWNKKLISDDPTILQPIQEEQESKAGQALEKITNVSTDEDIKTTFKLIRKMCREDIDMMSEQPELLTNMKCLFLSGPHPFLKLAPIKAEQLYTEPDIWMFHEVLYDDEISNSLNWGRGKLLRAGSTNKNKYLIYDEKRIAKAVGINAKEPFMARLLQRISDFTNLEIDSADKFQLLNYGVGGHNDMHHDWFGKETAEVLYGSAGDRLATTVLYFSDVTLGGATLFPALRLKVYPKKGSAIFWRNLNPAGDVDFMTYHQACPVLRGYKWIGTQWIHEIASDVCPVWYKDYEKKELMTEDIYLRKTSDLKVVTVKTEGTLIGISL